MQVSVKTMPSHHVASIRHVGPFPGIKGAFEKLAAWAGPRGLCATGSFLAVYYDDPDRTLPQQCRSDACLSVPEGTAGEGDVQIRTIPAGQYAVYRCEVVNNEFHKPWVELAEWIPANGYRLGDQACYEIYLNNGCQEPEGKWILDVCASVKPAGKD